jgi:hypothetical protein
MPKIVDLVVNGMVNRHYSIKAKAMTLYHKIINLHMIEEDQNSMPIIQKSKRRF